MNSFLTPTVVTVEEGSETEQVAIACPSEVAITAITITTSDGSGTVRFHSRKLTQAEVPILKIERSTAGKCLITTIGEHNSQYGDKVDWSANSNVDAPSFTGVLVIEAYDKFRVEVDVDFDDLPADTINLEFLPGAFQVSIPEDDHVHYEFADLSIDAGVALWDDGKYYRNGDPPNYAGRPRKIWATFSNAGTYTVSIRNTSKYLR